MLLSSDFLGLFRQEFVKKMRKTKSYSISGARLSGSLIRQYQVGFPKKYKNFSAEIS